MAGETAVVIRYQLGVLTNHWYENQWSSSAYPAWAPWKVRTDIERNAEYTRQIPKHGYKPVAPHPQIQNSALSQDPEHHVP